MTEDLAHPADATAAYMHGQMRKTHPALLAEFAAESEATIAACSPTLDVPYGAHPRETFDVYVSDHPWRATLAYFHAGYWQSRDKAHFRFLAPNFLAHGIDFVPVNYPLCPEVTLQHIVASAQLAVAMILQHMRSLGRGGTHLIACGHSAGGHLAVELGLSQRREIAAIVPVSGIYELTPLLATALNNNLRLDAAQARAMSPLHRVTGDVPPALFIVGDTETPAFRAQSAAMHAAWQSGDGKSSLVEVPEADHFTVLRSLPELVTGWMASS